MPVVAAERSRGHDHELLLVARRRVLDRPAVGTDAGGPVNSDIGLGGDQRSIGTVEHVEETVLGRLHEHLARLPVEVQVGEDDVLGRGEVPALARGGLVVPDVLPVVGPERHDRGEEEIVALAARALHVVPRRPVPDTDIQQVEVRIIGHRVPHRATAARRLPDAVRPGGARLRRHDAVGRRAVGFAIRIGRGVETPDQLPRLRVIGREVAADAVLGAAVPDQHRAFDHPRRTRDGVGLGLIDGDHRPDWRAGLRIERDQPAVEGADVHLPAPQRDAAVHHVATRRKASRAFDPRIVGPERCPGPGVEGKDLGPGGGRVEHTISHQRRSFLAAVGVELRTPCQTKLADRGGVDGGKGTVSLLGVGPAGRHPCGGVGVGGGQPCGVHGSSFRRRVAGGQKQTPCHTESR